MAIPAAAATIFRVLPTRAAAPVGGGVVVGAGGCSVGISTVGTVTRVEVDDSTGGGTSVEGGGGGGTSVEGGGGTSWVGGGGGTS